MKNPVALANLYRLQSIATDSKKIMRSVSTVLQNLDPNRRGVIIIELQRTHSYWSMKRNYNRINVDPIPI